MLNFQALLTQWPQLNATLRKTTHSKQVLPVLRAAVKHNARTQVIDRIYQRFSKLRAAEERRMINDGKLPVYLQ